MRTGTDIGSWFSKNLDVITGIGIVGILLVILIPLPAAFLDFFIITSFSASILVLLVSMYISRPIEFSAYPSLILVVTLFRLSLNVATTRRILLHGHELSISGGKVSQIIEWFGNVVIGGNYVVGLIIFAVLTLINLIVITRGAGRIAEVAARFTLDSLPGKQMAIDADLNSGLINEQEARKRREIIAREADFYGSMDGASKFVRGEAVAGMVIMFINIVGGILIGAIQKGLSIGDAANIYTKLTVGDGLIAQIPALITSTSAGMIVSRASQETEFTAGLVKQLFINPKALIASSVIIGFLGIIIMKPISLVFLAFSGGIALIALTLLRKEREEEIREKIAAQQLSTPSPQDETRDIESILHPDVLGLEVGYTLVPLVDESKNGEVVRRVKALRRNLAEELGIILPLIHIRDNLKLKPNEYSILIKGVEIVRSEIYTDRYLVIGFEKPEIEGLVTRDPIFGVEAIWIQESQKEAAKAMGYTIVDPPSVIITHLSEVVRRHAYEILTRQDTQKIVDIVKKDHPKLVEDLIPNTISLGVLHRVLQNLLKEGVPIKDIITILETIGDWAATIKDPDVLTEYVRQSLFRHITKMYSDGKGEIVAMTFDPRAEDIVSKSIEETEGTIKLKIEPKTIQKIITNIGKSVEKFIPHKAQPIIVTSASIRRYVRKIIESYYPNIPVISFQEIDPKVRIRAVAIVTLED